MKKEEILPFLENGLAAIRKAGDNFKISRIEFGSETYKDFCQEIQKDFLTKGLEFRITKYYNIPVKEIDYLTGIYIRIELI